MTRLTDRRPGDIVAHCDRSQRINIWFPQVIIKDDDFLSIFHAMREWLAFIEWHGLDEKEIFGMTTKYEPLFGVHLP